MYLAKRFAILLLHLLLFYQAPVSAAQNYLFPYKGPEDPLFVVVTGQSNAVQIIGSREPMQRNPLVWDWATDGEGDGQGNPTGPWFWQVPDPNGPLKADHGTGVITGYMQDNRGGIAWGLADTLAKATGRRVYMVCTAQGSQAISQWEPGVGLVGLELDMQVGNALQALQQLYPGVQFADIVVWAQGEADAFLETPLREYAEAWISWRDYVEGAGNSKPWANKDATRWYIVQIAQTGPVHTRWHGQQEVVNMDNNRPTLMPFGTKQTIFDGIHFWGDQATLYGQEIANHVLNPVTNLAKKPTN